MQKSVYIYMYIHIYIYIDAHTYIHNMFMCLYVYGEREREGEERERALPNLSGPAISRINGTSDAETALFGFQAFRLVGLKLHSYMQLKVDAEPAVLLTAEAGSSDLTTHLRPGS